MRFTRHVEKFKKPVEEVTDIENYMQLPQISFHGLRHTHATLLIANGENIKVVSDRLGHANITMTLNTYTHVLDDMKNKTANLLDKMDDDKLIIFKDAGLDVCDAKTKRKCRSSFKGMYYSWMDILYRDYVLRDKKKHYLSLDEAKALFTTEETTNKK